MSESVSVRSRNSSTCHEVVTGICDHEWKYSLKSQLQFSNVCIRALAIRWLIWVEQVKSEKRFTQRSASWQQQTSSADSISPSPRGQQRELQPAESQITGWTITHMIFVVSTKMKPAFCRKLNYVWTECHSPFLMASNCSLLAASKRKKLQQVGNRQVILPR